MWLGTFETGEEAAKAYDEAARLMSGPQAKTNFPFDPKAARPLLSSTLIAKLQRCYLRSSSRMQQSSHPNMQQQLDIARRIYPDRSLTCLRLDLEKSNLGIWQKKGGVAESNWVMTLPLDYSEAHHRHHHRRFASYNSSASCRKFDSENEDAVAAQMIEELLVSNNNSSPLFKLPVPPSSSRQSGVAKQFVS